MSTKNQKASIRVRLPVKIVCSRSKQKAEQQQIRQRQLCAPTPRNRAAGLDITMHRRSGVRATRQRRSGSAGFRNPARAGKQKRPPQRPPPAPEAICVITHRRPGGRDQGGSVNRGHRRGVSGTQSMLCCRGANDRDRIAGPPGCSPRVVEWDHAAPAGNGGGGAGEIWQRQLGGGSSSRRCAWNCASLSRRNPMVCCLRTMGTGRQNDGCPLGNGLRS